jgi:nanoRNase/pAp phosphatase (c-di-AMP/oligoRNAs hydrolase)
VIIGTEQGINQLSKNILNFIGIKFSTNPAIGKNDFIILIDTNTIQQLGTLADQLKLNTIPIIVVDHHIPHPKTKKIARLSIIDDSSPSTCEIVYNFYKELKIKPGLNESNALFLGIAADTRHFTLGNQSTFKTIFELGTIGVNPKEALSYLSLPMSFSERIARIKSCKRVQMHIFDKWIIALSFVSSYQASAARSIIDLGAHMVAVAGKNGEQIEISLRCTKEFSKKTGIHLGKDIAQPLGEYLQGMGGGHTGAAGLNGIGKVEDAFNQCLLLIKIYLSRDKKAKKIKNRCLT